MNLSITLQSIWHVLECDRRLHTWGDGDLQQISTSWRQKVPTVIARERCDGQHWHPSNLCCHIGHIFHVGRTEANDNFLSHSHFRLVWKLTRNTGQGKSYVSLSSRANIFTRPTSNSQFEGKSVKILFRSNAQRSILFLQFNYPVHYIPLSFVATANDPGSQCVPP